MRFTESIRSHCFLLSRKEAVSSANKCSAPHALPAASKGLSHSNPANNFLPA